ncbi:MAG: TIGR02281 family clan AA aspartic protease [Parvularculaceae bacterium]
MRAELGVAALVVVSTVLGVRYWETRTALPAGSVGQEEAVLAAAGPTLAPASPYAAGYGEEVKIAASTDHQYYVTAAVNAAPASFLIDTGASYVALRDSDARRAGIYTTHSDFRHPVRTANGETKAALIDIREIEIDGIRVESVKAFVLADDQLSVNLLGMSFLSKLESVEARGGQLVLRG